MTEDQVIKEYEYLVKKIASYYYTKRYDATSIVDYNDLYNVGLWGLIIAYRSYDESKEVKFTTHAVNRIKWAILEELRKQSHHTTHYIQKEKNGEYDLPKFYRIPLPIFFELFLVSSTNNRQKNSRYRILQPNQSEQQVEVLSQEFWEDILKLLPEKEKQVVKLLFLDDLSLREAGKKLSVSGEMIRKRKNSALQRIKRAHNQGRVNLL